MAEKKTPAGAVVSGVGGAVVLVAGLLLHGHFGPLKAACDSFAGRASQGFSNSLQQHCSIDSDVSLLAYLLIGLGALALLGALITGLAFMSQSSGGGSGRSGGGWQPIDLPKK